MSDLFGHAVVLLVDPSEEDWHTCRARGIGGSDVAAVVGLSPYKSNVELWAEKVGRRGDDFDGNEATYLGHLFEDTIAQAAAERLGLEVIGPPHVVLLQHPDLDFLLCTPDRIAQDEHGRVGPLEIKMTAGPQVAEDWADGAIPHAAALQLHHQMIVTGHDVGWIGALVGGYGHRVEVRRVERDQALVETLTATLAEFWQHVQDETIPAPNGAYERATATIKDLFDALGETGAQEIDVDTIALVDELAAQRAVKNAADREVKRLVAEVSHRMLTAEAEVGLVDGEPYVTWKSQTDTRIDAELVRGEPGFERFEVTTTKRVMRTPRKKGRG